jgi:prevent-host-death family protein
MDMYIKASAALRNDYSSISALAKETKEPIYITKNGEGDMVLMSIDAFEKREQMLELRSRVLKAEEERIRGDKTYSIDEVREMLAARVATNDRQDESASYVAEEVAKYEI